MDKHKTWGWLWWDPRSKAAEQAAAVKEYPPLPDSEPNTDIPSAAEANRVSSAIRDVAQGKLDSSLREAFLKKINLMIRAGNTCTCLPAWDSCLPNYWWEDHPESGLSLVGPGAVFAEELRSKGYKVSVRHCKLTNYESENSYLTQMFVSWGEQ